MRVLGALLLFIAFVPISTAQESGGFLKNVLRGVTGIVGGKDTSAVKPETSVLGIRGMDEADVNTAGPVPDALKLIDTWAATRNQAEATAHRNGLTARSVEYDKRIAEERTSGASQ